MSKSRRKHSTETHAVVCPPTQLPAIGDWKKFVELPYFRRKWRALGLSDEDLSALQVMITANPTLGPPIGGTGGLRKGRFAKRNSGRGKSGAYRVGYVYFKDLGVVGLIVVYAKDDQADIPVDQKPLIKVAIEQLRQWVVNENEAKRNVSHGPHEPKDPDRDHFR